MTGVIINNINNYIKENHIKQTWIAESLNTHKMIISNILSGKKKNVSLEEISSIIDILELDFNEICKSDFVPINVTMSSINGGLPEYIAYCGETRNPKTQETVGLIGELIEIIDTFKKTNSFSLLSKWGFYD